MFSAHCNRGKHENLNRLTKLKASKENRTNERFIFIYAETDYFIIVDA
ncbi:MAG: hypothetical protein N838_22075 [Thiohalocapsa sp. PB-PSB1]|nr:MAG: hypothetical protein N838_22075 [Thiohalocapsa sp. PB-PSB1]